MFYVSSACLKVVQFFYHSRSLYLYTFLKTWRLRLCDAAQIKMRRSVLVWGEKNLISSNSTCVFHPPSNQCLFYFFYFFYGSFNMPLPYHRSTICLNILHTFHHSLDSCLLAVAASSIRLGQGRMRIIKFFFNCVYKINVKNVKD